MQQSLGTEDCKAVLFIPFMFFLRNIVPFSHTKEKHDDEMQLFYTLRQPASLTYIYIYFFFNLHNCLPGHVNVLPFHPVYFGTWDFL